MPYIQEISRKHRTCFLFLVDQSRSMHDSFGGASGGSKAQAVADVLNTTLRELSMKTLIGNEIRDYFDIGVIGYGKGKATPVLGGSMKGRNLIPIPEFMPNPLRIEERTGDAGQKTKCPIWVETIADGDTPMVQALKLAQVILNEWISHRHNQESHPPVVINITDGEATDGTAQEVMQAANELRAVATADGNVLLWNCHISSAGGTPVLLPNSSEGLPEDPYARQLFDASSILPPPVLSLARTQLTPPPGPNARGFAFNARFAELVKLVDMGSQIPAR